MHSKYLNPRLDHAANTTTSTQGEVVLDFGKLLWLGGVGLSGTVGAALTFSWSALLLFVFFTAAVLLFGHSLGMHRLFIHKAFAAPKWLQLCLIHMGTLVGIAGPLGMLKTHDTRDWAQRQTQCHDFFAHNKPWWQDLFWQLFCRFELLDDLKFEIEDPIRSDRALYWMERTWMLQQLPWALLLYYLGGWSFVFWGISARILICNLGHWLIGYFAHNQGHRHWHVDGAAVQGHDVRWTSLLTMGECWHNNHHAFPFSAKFGLLPGQWDPGWWVLLILEKLGLVSDLVVADINSPRIELIRL